MSATLNTPGRFMAPAPPERLAALRVLVTGFAMAYLVVRTPYFIDVFRLGEEQPARFSPVGPVAYMDQPVSMAVGVAALVATMAVGVGAVAGWRWRVTGPTFAFGVLAIMSYRNSWGQIFHTENLLVLHLAILAIAPASDAWSLDRRRSGRAATDRVGARPVLGLGPRSHSRYGWPIQLMVVVVVVAYVLAGLAKVRAGGLAWASGDVLRNLVAHDSLRKVLVGDTRASPVGGWVLRNDWLFPPMAVLSLAVELGAPIALVGGRWRTGWVIAAWLFHVGVLAVMTIFFAYQLLGVAFACCFAIETLPSRWKRGVSAILATNNSNRPNPGATR